MSKNKKIILAIATAIPLVLMVCIITLGLKVKKANNSMARGNYAFVSSHSQGLSDKMIKQALEQSGEKNVIVRSEMQTDARSLRLLNAFQLLYVFALSIIYIVVIAQNNTISSSLKAFWIIAVLFGGAIAMPFYWFKYVWKALPEEVTVEV